MCRLDVILLTPPPFLLFKSQPTQTDNRRATHHWQAGGWFYTKVTHKVDHQHAAAGQDGLAEVRTGMAAGGRRVTDCPVQEHTRHEQGLTGTEQDGTVGPASLWQPTTAVLPHAQDTGLGTKKPSSGCGASRLQGPRMSDFSCSPVAGFRPTV